MMAKIGMKLTKDEQEIWDELTLRLLVEHSAASDIVEVARISAEIADKFIEERRKRAPGPVYEPRHSNNGGGICITINDTSAEGLKRMLEYIRDNPIYAPDRGEKAEPTAKDLDPADRPLQTTRKSDLVSGEAVYLLVQTAGQITGREVIRLLSRFPQVDVIRAINASLGNGGFRYVEAPQPKGGAPRDEAKTEPLFDIVGERRRRTLGSAIKEYLELCGPKTLAELQKAIGDGWSDSIDDALTELYQRGEIRKFYVADRIVVPPIGPDKSRS